MGGKEILIITALIVCTHGLYFSNERNGIVATVDFFHDEIVQFASRDLRPDEILFEKIKKFRINLADGRSFDLLLERNDKQTPKVMVTVASDSGTEIYDTDKPKDYRFYQVLGDNHGAALLVRCPDFKPKCYIAGSFYYEGEEYEIDPATGLADLASDVEHIVYPDEPAEHSYGHDTVVKDVHTRDTDDTIEEERLIDLLNRLFPTALKQMRTRRSTGQRNYQIELEIVVCDDIVKFWKDKLGQNRDAALQKIVEYYEQVANNMDLRFSSVTTSKMTFDIVPYSINIRETPDKCPWITTEIVGKNEAGIESYNADNTLMKFDKWAQTNKNPKVDAIMLFSRRDMWSEGKRTGKDTTGLANSYENNGTPESALCSTNIAASIVEDLTIGDTASTAAHELAHNMGVDHDNAYNGKIGTCPAEKYFVMSPGSGFPATVADAKNIWTFSPCSITIMEKTQATMPKDQNGKTCLEKHTYDVNNYNRIMASSTRLGEIYSRDEQCAFIHGPTSKYCDPSQSEIRLEDICWKGIPCSKGGSCESFELVFPASGTNCGGTKQCYKGLCTEASKIPTGTGSPVSPSGQKEGTSGTDKGTTGEEGTTAPDDSATEGTTEPDFTTTDSVSRHLTLLRSLLKKYI